MPRYIDADALHKAITTRFDECEEILEVLDEQPTIKERKKGKWIMDRLVTSTGGTYGVRRCSECESYYQDIGYGWNYCPDCGAEMEGEE